MLCGCTFQRLGFGTQLFDQMHKSLVRKNIHKIKVQSTQTALSYYQKMDFSHQIINRKMKKIIIYINTLLKLKIFMSF